MFITDYIYPELKSSAESVFNNDAIMKTVLSAPIYPQAIVMPVIASINSNKESTERGGVNDSCGIFINGTNFQTNTEIGYPYDNVDYRDEDVLYIGFLHSCYGHFITDSISKLWYIHTEEYINKPKPLVCISLNPLKKWQYELLELAGVDTSKFEVITELTRFRSVQIPDNAQIRQLDGTHLYNERFADIIESIIRSALVKGNATKDKKIYLSRSNWTRSYCDYGERQVIKQFKRKGYKIVSPEQYSVTEQILMMQGADEIVSTDCSCAHNAIFMRKGCKMVLLRKGLYNNEYSAMIASMRQLETTIIDCSLSLLNRVGGFSYAGPFFIYVNGNLSAYLGIRKPFFPFRLFKKYLQEAWRYTNLPEHYMMEEIYAKILANELAETRQRISNAIKKVLIGSVELKEKISNRLSRHCMDFLIS